jgi:hypothetical protein
MEWIILFIVSWLLFFLMVDWNSLKKNMFCGLFSMLLQLCVDHYFIVLKLYVIKKPIIDLLGTSLFFVCGPIFVVGTLLAQYQPKKKYLRIINLIVLSALFSVQEILLLSRNMLVYLNWHHIESIEINVFAIGLISWFSIVVLEEKRCK